MSISVELQETMDRIYAELVGERDGKADQARWVAEDGWLVGYTTSRIEGGPHDGKFAAFAYKPTGKGARGGRKTAENWQRVYIRAFAKRKTAKARALTMYAQHSPGWGLSV